jgi:sugar-specific transcriptional regulator TrmB
MQFQTELKKLGLKDKEAAVYLACLELGSAPVQPIARKARVVRATTYVILEALMRLGLVTKFEQGKKTMFSAEPPHQLLRLLERQEEEIREKEQFLKNILPELQILMKGAGDRPTVRYVEGIEGLRAIRREQLMYCRTGDVIYHFTPLDYTFPVYGDDEEFYRQRVAKGIKARIILATKSEKTKHYLHTSEGKLLERRYVPETQAPFTSGMSIYRDRVSIGSYSGKLIGVVIESQPISDLMRVVFDLAWHAADKSIKK